MKEYERNFINENKISEKSDLIELLNSSIDKLNLTVQTDNALRRNDISLVGQIMLLEEVDYCVPRSGRIAKKICDPISQRDCNFSANSIKTLEGLVEQFSTIIPEIRFGMKSDELRNIGVQISRQSSIRELDVQIAQLYNSILASTDGSLTLKTDFITMLKGYAYKMGIGNPTSK